ncbi:glycosyltransferase family 4 protein [Paenibacillus mendelii]|uniref:Glycosyltransferase family 4 protein n=1 Tax=Paenibacillus mendelii TaxID=206163 RepID=A0ABV6JA32_9BACL|nr:glycosyltransferase family 4 protein [Paenibacillus mendelii]MCQ6559677.1 glycosyltransferase family 4 protein [Paenibacillus mendelii]
MARPKIAFVTPGAFPLPSPNSSSVERVVEKLVPLLVPAVEACIYGRTGRALPRRGMLKGAKCVRYPAVDKLKYVRNVGQAIRRYAPDVTEVENRPRTVLRLKRMRPQGRIWLNLHSTTFIGKKAIPPSMLSRSFRLAERIIVNSEFLRDVVSRRVPSCAHKVNVVYPGVDTDRFISQFSMEGAYKREQLRFARGWSGRDVVLFMGRLIPMKGVHHLLHLMPELMKEHPSVLLVVVGGAFYGSKRTTAYVRELHRLGKSLQGHVQFVPYVPYSDVPDWFLGADVAVVPSSSREAFGLVNVEAMACGLPVVATRSGGMKEIIEDGVTGFLVDPSHVETEMRSRILSLLRDDMLRSSMGMLSRERVEQRFTWHHTAEQWLTLLRGSGIL